MDIGKKYVIHIYIGENRILMIPMIRHFYNYSFESEYFENIKEIDNRVIVAKAIASCLEYIEYEPLSKATPKEIDQNEAWKKNTKYKSWKAFWKNNNMLYFRIEPNGEFLLSARKKTVDGGRGEYNDIYQSITLPSTTSYEDIAKKVVEMLKEVEEYYLDKSNIPGY